MHCPTVHAALMSVQSCVFSIEGDKTALSVLKLDYCHQEDENSTSFCALCKSLVHCPTVHVALVSVQSCVFSIEGDKTLANLLWLPTSIKSFIRAYFLVYIIFVANELHDLYQ